MDILINPYHCVDDFIDQYFYQQKILTLQSFVVIHFMNHRLIYLKNFKVNHHQKTFTYIE